MASELHKCQESKSRNVYHESYDNGEVSVGIDDDIVSLGTCDVYLVIAFCPFCGKKLGDLPPAEKNDPR